MTIDYTLLIATALVAYVGYEAVQNPFQPVLKPFDDLEPVTCHPATQPSGFANHRETWEFRIGKTAKDLIFTGKTHHEWVRFSGDSFFDCQDQLIDWLMAKNQPALWSPNFWCLKNCYQWTYNPKPKNQRKIGDTTDASTLGHPAYCTRSPWDLNFPDE